jgi:hypothetical protein
MVKRMRKVNGWMKRNSGLVTLLFLGLAAAAFMIPQQATEPASQADGGSNWWDVLGLFDNDNLSVPDGEVRRFLITYESGNLENQGSLAHNDALGSEFSVSSTAAGGDPAKFDVFCGSDVCGTASTTYQDPYTAFVVQVPELVGMTKLVVTAGGDSLEIPLE